MCSSHPFRRLSINALALAILSGQAVAQTASELRISEIGSNSYYTDYRGWTRNDVPVWFELINAGTKSISTAGYQIKTTASDKSGKLHPVKTFDLPVLTIPPQGVVLIRARRPGDADDDKESQLSTSILAFLGDENGNFPIWKWSGFVELLRQGKTADFVRFGANTQNPATANQWQGDSAAALPYGQNKFGYALARSRTGGDTNTAADWTMRHFATPAGPNDVTCNEDVEGDGLPDCSEQPGSTYSGLPLYDWGARADKRDIFVEVDYMLHDTSKGPGSLDDPGTIPQRAALERVREAFKAKDIAIHFDAGSFFHPAKGTSPIDFDLGGGGPVPFKKGLMFGKDTDMSNWADIYDYKRKYMDLARKHVFHYLVFGHTRNAEGRRGSSGRAELPGNDLIVTLGKWGLNSSNDAKRNQLINFQAGTIMHEFGHNLGLKHGGSDHDHYKPNYFSTMNYFYQLDGLPDHKNAKAGDRYYYRMMDCTPGNPACPIPPGCLRYETDSDIFHDGPQSEPMKFRIDYSDGSGSSIDEAAINEKKGLGRAGGAAIDFNCDGVISDNPISFNVDDVPDISVVTDYNDWNNIKLYFQRVGDGDRTGLTVALEQLRTAHPNVSIRVADEVPPIAKDRQPLSDEPDPPPEFFRKIRELAK